MMSIKNQIIENSKINYYYKACVYMQINGPIFTSLFK